MTRPLSALEKAARGAARAQRKAEAAEQRRLADAAPAVDTAAAERSALLWQRATRQQRTDASDLLNHVLDGSVLCEPGDWYVLPDSTSVARFDDHENGLSWAAYMQMAPGAYGLGRLGLGVRRLADTSRTGFTPVASLADLGAWLSRS